MHRTVGLCVLLLTACLAGCLGDEGAPGSEQVPAAPDEGRGSDEAGELAWGVSGCRVVVAIIPVEAEALKAHLPEGFETVSGAEAFGTPEDPRGDGALGIETFRCETGQGLNGTVEDLAYGAIFTVVEPPANVTVPDVNKTFYKWATLVPDDPRRQALSAAGLPVVDGDSDLSGFQQAPTGTHTFEASVSLGEATFTFSGTTGQPAQAFREGFSFAELQHADDGYATWITLENGAAGGNSGTGTVGLPSGHWTTDVVGSQSSQAYMVASGDVTFEQASILLP